MFVILLFRYDSIFLGLGGPWMDPWTESYVDFPLLEEVKKKIYTPEFPITKHGITPDYAIDHIESKKTLYVEVRSGSETENPLDWFK